MTKTELYKQLMMQCIENAKKGKWHVEPNPYVGAIVYDEEKKEIISSGYHRKYGGIHAEVDAINNANGNTLNKTIIVNLEPCSHFGKTPPCCDLIIKSGFKRVVIAQIDPNPLVQGKGILKLKNADIDVVVGILEKEAFELNKVFIKNIKENMPYVMLKCATTLDFKIALNNGKSKWITNEFSRLEVQKIRSEYQAIMSASGTILSDNPKLNVRIDGLKSPCRIIFDPNNKLSIKYSVFNNDGNKVIWINNSEIEVPEHIIKLDFDGNFKNLFKKLYKMGIYSIMVEAGSGFNSLLLKNNLIDEINHFIAPKIFGDGLLCAKGFSFNEINDCINLHDIKIKHFGDDILINGKIKKDEE